MSTLRILCVVATILAVCGASPTENSVRYNAVSGSLKPSNWLTPVELENTPSMDELTMKQLEEMPLEKGAYLVRKWYHISQINNNLLPSFVPSPSNIPVYIVKNDGNKVICNLNNFVEMAQKQSNFGLEEVTIFLTGLPSTTETIKKANRKLIQAYLERYNYKQEQPEKYKYSDEQVVSRTASEETSSEWKTPKSTSGNLVVIDLGQSLNNIKRLTMLNVEETGAMIGKTLVKLTSECDMPHEIIHVVAQGVAAHVAGAAGNEYTRLTGRKLRRITALDPSKIMAKDPKVLTGLSRGDADFVDAIHTSAYGMGTLSRVGDIDFYPHGPCDGVPGTQNVVEASMRATRYFAESVRPGNERNFPAVEAKSLMQYKSNNGYGQRAYMGIVTDYDLRGDYILEVNEKSPFGMRTPARKQNTYHGIHNTRSGDNTYN